ncbi:hypothetical protein [Alkaliphilus serpentinus]|uniref:Uncharacterized protein n=1 Tax=Alkaliphilus serpentinus TaxID=1482731 RepID=A0A833HLG6_9FIRM|nr:hypothetical protein [Alkaliphilus serpentinus]KAB3525832.1 hypothetical protein F8153_14565 [Alkaliphilus serpentinus]
MNRYVIRTENGTSTEMTREEAIQRVKEYEQQGINAYIISVDEENRIQALGNEFNKPKWG